MDFNEAQELLNAAIQQDAQGAAEPSLPQQSGQEQAPPPAEQSSPQGDQGAASPQDSFTPINPDDLPEELQPLAKQLLADYTRKTQAVAEQRKAFEQLGDIDPARALEAYQFVNALQTDPQVAVQVHQELTRALQEQGLTPAQAQAEATRQMQGGEADDPYAGMDWMDELGFGQQGVAPEIQQRLDKFEQFMAEQQAAQEQQQQIMELQRQEYAIRQSHPEYQEGDMQRIYELAAWHGDLVRAEQEYATMRSEWAASFLKEKASVPSSTPQSAGPGQVAPEPPHNLDEADAMAREYLRNAGLL